MTKCKKYFVNILTIWYNYFVKKKYGGMSNDKN